MKGYGFGAGVESTFSGSRIPPTLAFHNHPGTVEKGRLKFRPLTSRELSKGNKRKAFRCQESREMFVDFLLRINYIQLGFEANFLIEKKRFRGVAREVHDLVAVHFQTAEDPQQL